MHKIKMNHFEILQFEKLQKKETPKKKCKK